MVQLSEAEPEKLPWLISFEEFSAGRAYQGHSEIALRPAAGGSDTALNEALALEMTAAAGQTTQDHGLTSFGVNGGTAVPRMVLDAPDAAWAEQRGGGVLYKARANGSLDYLGDDPTDYEEAFEQLNGEGTYDLQPVMNLLRFIAESDDAEFAAELDEHVDVQSFARYLALQNLMSNGDAMDGPGNNYYLWYDTGQERFTVLSWDLNLSFGAMEDMLPSGRMPDGPPPGGGPPDGPPGGGDDRGGGPGGMRGSGALKDRFLADDDFRALYEQAYADLHRDLVADGTAAELVNEVQADAQRAGDGTAVDEGAQLHQEVASISERPEEDSGFPGR
nr:CotH kinase family protein [Saccharopolyspora sp. HNM0983]